MKILKFGGTSVGDTHSIEQICYILRDKKKQEDRYAIIVSAIGGITDKLINCAQYASKKNEKYHLILDEIEIKHLKIIIKLFTNFHKKKLISRIIKFLNKLELFYDSICHITYFSKSSLDKIMNFGELISSYLINEKLKENLFYSIWKDSRELLVVDNQYDNIQVNIRKSILNIKFFFLKENASYIILPGFIASSEEEEIATLGRGGSDYSASIFSSALQTESLEIWTDVSGIMTAHPKIVSKSFTQEVLSYIDSIELSHFGAKIIYPPTLFPSMNKNIPIIIRNTFSPLERGTLIFNTCDYKGLITGITGIQNITLLMLEKNLCMHGYLNIFASFTNDDNYLIKQSNCNSEKNIEKQIIRELTNNIGKTYLKNKELCMIAIIVNDLKNRPVTLGRMFFALGEENINLHIIVSTERNLYAIVEKKYFKKSMYTLHEILFERHYKIVHIFIMGLGKVGRKLIEQLHKQKEYLVEELLFKIKVIAVCNSKRMFFLLKGKNINNIQNNLKLGSSMMIKKFIDRIYNLNLRNSLFIDTTDSKEIANIYYDFLGKGIGVVTCNKVACASSYQEYKNVKNLARYFKTPFFFESNVGSSLPIINTLNTLTQSGDKIYLIDAVLSGTLNFIFNKVKGIETFTEIIMEAKNRVFTEADTRIDLSGIDVIRKILILIRECGESIEIEDIKQISLIPKSCVKSFTVDSFYQELILNEELFTQKHTTAKEQRRRIRFMARYKDGEASVGLEVIEFDNQFYLLDGKDNMFSYVTKRYVNQPLIVKGSGITEEVTASGVFSDIIKASI